MASRGQSLTVPYVAWDTDNNAGKTGDVGNHTLRWIKDGTSAAAGNSPAEVDATNAPGVYKVALTADECTCWLGTLCGKSSTANVSIIPVMVAFETVMRGTDLAALALTALSNAVWIDAKAAYLDSPIGPLGTQIAQLNDLSQGAVRNALGMSSADLDDQLAAIVALDGSTFTSLPDVTTDAASRTASRATGYAVAGDAMTLTAGERNAVADAHLGRTDGVETGVTPRQYMQRAGAVVAGKISGAGGGTEIFVGMDGVTTRVTVTVDADGNRTAITYV